MPFKEPVQKTLRAQWLGQQMRELRRQRGMTLKAASEYLGRDHSALARYETAEWPFKRTDVLALLDIYGVFDGQERARLLQLADDAWRTNEWDVDFADAIYDSTFVDYTWLESHARLICAYSTHLLPGLLHTRAYAEAMIRLTEGDKAPPEKIERWIELRMERQRVLETGNAKLSVVLDDVVLRRSIAGEIVLREQLVRLSELARKPNVEVRILPININLSARFNGSFWLFKMPDPYPEVAYLENLAGRIYLESPRSKRFVVAYDRLREAALSPSESAKLIAHAAEDLS